VIPKPQHAVAARFQFALPFGIRGFSPGVRIAIQFHNQQAFTTKKVNDIPPDWSLPTKFEALKSSIAESFPQFCFGWRQLMAHLPREFQYIAVDGHCEDPKNNLRLAF